MIRYTVVWHQLAEDELLRLWLDAVEGRSITESANAIDRELAVDPDTKGESIVDNLRELRVPPLRVLFSFSKSDRLVEVAGVALT